MHVALLVKILWQSQRVAVVEVQLVQPEVVAVERAVPKFIAVNLFLHAQLP